MTSPSDTGAICRFGWPGWCVAIRPWHAVNVLSFLALLTGLAGYPLLDPDEGRYGEIPREMLERGDLVSPTLNYVPYWEKPPLLYWINAAGLRLLGETPLAVRLGTALSAVLGLAVAWWLARVTYGSRAARWAPGILAGSWMYFVVARVPIIDMLFSVLLAASLTAWWSAENSAGAGRGGRWALAGVFLGLAILAKGPVAVVLFVGVVGAYLLLQRRWLDLAGGLLVPVAVSAAVAAPWFVAMAARHPTFLHYFFVVQHVERFLGNAGRVEHAKPVWYYLAMAAPAFMPWTALWPGMAVWVVSRWRGLPPEHRQIAHYLLAWALVVMLFFSASSCKLVQYVLPAWWVLAVTAAAWLGRRMDAGAMPAVIRRAFIAVGCGLVLLAVGMIAVASRQDEVPLPAVREPLALFCLVAAICASLFLLVGLPGDPDRRLGLLMAAAILPSWALTPLYAQVAMRRDMNNGLIPRALVQLPKTHAWTIAQYRCYNQTLNFRTHSRVVLIDEINELALGPSQPDADRWFLRGEGQITRLAKRGPLALVVDADWADDVAYQHKLHIWQRNKDRAMLLNAAGLKLASPPPDLSPHRMGSATTVAPPRETKRR